jgi:iron uptake system component EfeO
MPEQRQTAVLGLASLAVLTLAACGGSGGSTTTTAATASDDIAVAATDTTCSVGVTELSAGTHRFTVTNKGSKINEFEILAGGDRILGEVENIAPGVARTLIVELPAGKYQAACLPGMIGDGIRHPLTVTGASGSSSDDEQLKAAVTSYTSYVQTQVQALQQQTTQFTAAVEAGDVAKAQALYPLARSFYERIEPVAESFGDLDPKIDARENDVEPGDTWTGFHVLEKTLWTGGDLATAGPVADQLNTDVADLATRVKKLDLTPLDLANGALGLLDEIATTKITGEEDRYSHTDLYDVAANLEGSQQAVQSLRPVIADRDAALATQLDEQFAAVSKAMEPYRQGEGWQTYTALSQDQLRGLSDAVNALASAVSQVPGQVAR